MDAIQTVTLRVFIIIISIILITSLFLAVQKSALFNNENSYSSFANRITQKVTFIVSTDVRCVSDSIKIPKDEFGINVDSERILIRSPAGRELSRAFHISSDYNIVDYNLNIRESDAEKDLNIIRNEKIICFSLEGEDNGCELAC
jgi:YbbR domain-containing protein